jgi:hypothetical protein
VARPEQHRFFSNTSTPRRVRSASDQALVRLLHYSKAKGGRHENQDQCEGWTEDFLTENALAKYRCNPNNRIPKPPGKQAAFFFSGVF